MGRTQAAHFIDVVVDNRRAVGRATGGEMAASSFNVEPSSFISTSGTIPSSGKFF
jgi:hypothetical protein